MKIILNEKTYEGLPVCRACWTKHYPDNSEDYPWLGVYQADGSFNTIPIFAPCHHCGKVRKCAFRMARPNPQFSVTE